MERRAERLISAGKEARFGPAIVGVPVGRRGEFGERERER